MSKRNPRLRDSVPCCLPQILGISNYSRWDDAPALRQCFFTDAAFQEAATDFAMEMLEHYIHVGLTPNLKASMDTLLPLIDRAWSSAAWRTATPGSLTELCRAKRAGSSSSSSRCSRWPPTGSALHRTKTARWVWA